jgi:hypothetical protein
MNDIHLVTCDNDITEPLSSGRFFSLQNTDGFWCSVETLHHDEDLERVVFLITRKPKCLVSHMRRIHYCFQKSLSNQLFAAIIDFLVVLNKRGQAISWRVVLGSKSRLNTRQFEELKSYLKGENSDANLLTGNQYSVFSRGLIGANKMIQQVEKKEEIDDPLTIALDHIEYSQLDEARDVLEEAILAHPERQDLRQELISLYKSTNDMNRFYQMLAKLTRLGVSMTDDWNQLNNYFKGRNNNG